MRAVWNLFLQSRRIKLDLPTAASPANTSLYIRSGSAPSDAVALRNKQNENNTDDNDNNGKMASLASAINAFIFGCFNTLAVPVL